MVVVFGNFLCFFSSWWLFLVIVVGGEFSCGGCLPVAWWWQGGHFHVVVLTMVGVWVCSWWRERDKGGRKKEKIKEEIFFFGYIF